MNCGCTMHHPMCAVGVELFTTFVWFQQQWHAAPAEQQEKHWEDVSSARGAYIDHVQGWRQGDVRVRQQKGSWRLERRQREQWTFQFGMTGEETLRAWLKAQGFWRYAQIDIGETQDRLTGYYHQRTSRAGDDSENNAATTKPLWQDGQRNAPSHAQKGDPPFEDHLSAEVDQTTEMALLIAVLVGRFSHPLTLVDRLSLQRKAVSWLVSRGVQQIGADERHTIAVLIEKAIALREMLEHQNPNERRQ
jgi:hypothetical protein